MNFELRFTDREITAWGGMALMKRMLEHLGFEQALEQAQLPQPGSNRGYAPAQLMTQFLLSIWCGANRFEHCEVTRFDAVLKRIFGFERMANFKAVMRLFRRFTPSSRESVVDSLYRWLFGHISVDGVTLDLDSTVMTRYGTQQGAAKGYNPSKPGRLSHHPLMAFVSESSMVANCWLRPGNTSSANNVQGFLLNTLHRLGNKRVALLRADSGFCDNALLEFVERQGMHYTIACKLTHPLQRALVDAGRTGHGWWSLKDDQGKDVPGIELTRFSYQAASWSKPRWVTGIRQHVNKREPARGKTLSLFAQDEQWGQYRLSAIVSDMDLPAEAIWRMYRGRANCENRIKELKYDFAAGSFNMKEFGATEVALNMAMLAYNLMSLFRQALVKATVKKNGVDTPISHTLQTLRYKLFARPAYVTTESRKHIFNMSLAMQQREWLKGLWDQARSFDLPVTFASRPTAAGHSP